MGLRLSCHEAKRHSPLQGHRSIWLCQQAGFHPNGKLLDCYKAWPNIFPPVRSSADLYKKRISTRVKISMWQRFIWSKLCLFQESCTDKSCTDNWCFWIRVLEKTLKSTLDSNEIKPVNPKGNQPWIFIGRTEAEGETPILWPPDANSWLTGKYPDAGKDWRQKEKRAEEDEMVG